MNSVEVKFILCRKPFLQSSFYSAKVRKKLEKVQKLEYKFRIKTRKKLNILSNPLLHKLKVIFCKALAQYQGRNA